MAILLSGAVLLSDGGGMGWTVWPHGGPVLGWFAHLKIHESYFCIVCFFPFAKSLKTANKKFDFVVHMYASHEHKDSAHVQASEVPGMDCV